MYDIQVTETEAEKPEVQLAVTVFFHADCDVDSSFMANANAELYTRSEKIRQLVQDALSEDEHASKWAYPEVRLTKRTIKRLGYPEVTLDIERR